MTIQIQLMHTGQNPVSPGASYDGGFVSGNPASLADGAQVTAVFDLGNNWDQWPVAQVSISPVGATSFTAIALYGSDTVTLDSARRLRSDATAGFSGLTGTITTSGGAQAALVRPMGRFLFVQATNTAAGGAMGASKITVALYPA